VVENAVDERTQISKSDFIFVPQWISKNVVTLYFWVGNDDIFFDKSQKLNQKLIPSIVNYKVK
jgi:hypothetical protein